MHPQKYSEEGSARDESREKKPVTISATVHSHFSAGLRMNPRCGTSWPGAVGKSAALPLMKICGGNSMPLVLKFLLAALLALCGLLLFLLRRYSRWVDVLGEMLDKSNAANRCLMGECASLSGELEQNRTALTCTARHCALTAAPETGGEKPELLSQALKGEHYCKDMYHSAAWALSSSAVHTRRTVGKPPTRRRGAARSRRMMAPRPCRVSSPLPARAAN